MGDPLAPLPTLMLRLEKRVETRPGRPARENRRMEFGTFMEFPPVGAAGESRAFDQALSEGAAADEWGLDAVWLAQVHRAPERSGLAAPVMVGSALAGCTQGGGVRLAGQGL